MLDYNILSKKPTLIKDDEEFIDLSAQTYVNKETVYGNMIVVNKYYVARPDLISLAIYGDDKYADIICKVNGISNPFELNEDDIIFVPAIDELISMTAKAENTSELISDSSSKLIELENDIRKKASEKRAPNEMVVGDSNYIIDRSLGLIFY